MAFTDYETTIAGFNEQAIVNAQKMAKAFQRRTKPSEAITTLQIITTYGKQGIHTNEWQVRTMVHYVAQNLLPNLIECEQGFYCAVELSEIAQASRELYQEAALLIKRVEILNQFIDDNQ